MRSRPVRYRGIRSRRFQRMVKAVSVATGLAFLIALGIVGTEGRSDGGLSTSLVVALGLVWAAGIALWLRAKLRRLLEEEHDRQGGE